MKTTHPKKKINKECREKVQLLKAKAGLQCEQGYVKNSEVPTSEAVFMAGSSAPLQISADSHNIPGRRKVLCCTHTSLPLLTSPPRLRRAAFRGENSSAATHPPAHEDKADALLAALSLALLQSAVAISKAAPCWKPCQGSRAREQDRNRGIYKTSKGFQEACRGSGQAHSDRKQTSFMSLSTTVLSSPYNPMSGELTDVTN